MGVQVQKSEPPESTVVLAASIVKISEAMNKLLTEPGGLNTEAIVLLLHDYTKVGKPGHPHHPQGAPAASRVLLPQVREAMTHVFNQFGKLIGLAFEAAELPPVEPVLVFDDRGRLVGSAFA